MKYFKTIYLLILFFILNNNINAQTSLVSTLNGDIYTSYGVDYAVYGTVEIAQSFTTGSYPCKLSSIKCSYASGGGNASVMLYSSISGDVGSLLHTLTSGGNSGSVYTYTTTSDVFLGANTTYWISVGSTNTTYWNMTTDPSEGEGTIPTDKTAADYNGSSWSYYDITTGPYLFEVNVFATTQTTNIAFSDVQNTQMTIGWTNGNGTKRAVFMKQAAGSITNPTDNNTYTASSDWNSKGTQLGASGYYCIYNGTGSSVTVTNINSSTAYYVQAFEYLGSAGGEKYYSATAVGNPNSQSTLPVELTSFKVELNGSTVILNWITATEVNNYGFDIERRITLNPAFIRGDAASAEEDWETLGFVEGNGNSNSQKIYSFTDATPPCGKVQYRLKQIDFEGTNKFSSVVEVTIDAPAQFALEQNYPNPSNPTTVIRYQLPVSGKTVLKVYDILGKEAATLVDEIKTVGNYEVKFDGSNLSSGVYIYRLQAGNFIQTRKLMLLK